MEKYLSLLKNSKLFQGISEDELASMLDCLSAVTRSYHKGEYVFSRGERIDSVALLLEGCCWRAVSISRKKITGGI